MKRQSKGMSFEIRGDEQEQYRIELEHNLQNTEFSFHMSTDDEHGPPRRRHIDSSVEYPRHISEPSLAEYPSFAHRSRDHSMGDEMHSPHHAWSYRTGEDEDGINPFGAETMSTPAHHASAVTISAGLGGGRTARIREPSLSGAEYDPDRPLHAMMNGVNHKNTTLDIDPSKSKQQITFDPIVVDNTAELDRLLESGHAPPPVPSRRSRSVRLASPVSPGSSSTSDSSGLAQQTSRPRLTDHLRHVSFSPTRPRSAQGFNPTSPVAARSGHRAAANLSNKSMNVPTPRASRRPISQTSLAAEVRVQPPTPSTAGSKFTRMAKGINKDIEATRQQILSDRLPSSSSRPTLAQPIERNPFHDDPEAVSTHFRMPASRKSSLKDATRSRIYLPDVTGLTNAVESPLRPGAKYYPYMSDRPRDAEARLLQILGVLQSQLGDLEEENSISRRRIRELEMELEECKREVVRERTRLIEREELRKSDASFRATSSRAKGKNKAKDVSGFGRPELDDEKVRARYKEAVDEKKALEALVDSLRSHLTRLTAELSSHQELLADLKKLREQDSRALQEKSIEILQLREEVQRLAGEVEVLRGIVEEGLKERRASKDSIQIEREVELEEIRGKEDISLSRQEDDDDDAGITQDEDEEVEGPEQHTVILDPPGNVADKTIRTDRATLGESTHSRGVGVQFVDEDDLDKIAAEVEERRSNISNGSISSAVLRSPSPVKRPSKSSNRATLETIVDGNHRQHSLLHHGETSIPRPSAPTPNHAAEMRTSQPTRNQDVVDADPETPFPRIRGEHLERLFFSAPEHNDKTCAVCYRRRDRAPWTRVASGSQREETVPRKSGGHEGLVDDQGPENFANMWGGRRKGKQRNRDAFSEDHPEPWHNTGKNHGLQPQTVVARVIRELEDDFTHYKSIYVELADQYKVMDAVSDVPRRNMLARHLREVVDILEQKGNQIASLYDVLSFKDKPISESDLPDHLRAASPIDRG